jgi:RNA polymerase sigma factor (sigma-70 family)
MGVLASPPHRVGLRLPRLSSWLTPFPAAGGVPSVPHDDIDNSTRACVRRKVARIIGRAGLAPQDRDDLEQELIAKVLERLGPPDPCRRRDSLVATVVERLAANLLRERRARKRRAHVRSLNSHVPTADGPAELAAVVGAPAYDARRGRRPRSEEELARLAADVDAVLASLPDDLRELAERLKSQPVAEAARAKDVPRTTLYEQVRRLRRRFERAGLRDYLA